MFSSLSHNLFLELHRVFAHLVIGTVSVRLAYSSLTHTFFLLKELEGASATMEGTKVSLRGALPVANAALSVEGAYDITMCMTYCPLPFPFPSHHR